MTDPGRTAGGSYAVVAILLHWLIAALIVLQIVLAGRMEGPLTPESFAVTQLHKSVGISILLLSLARLGWRLLNPPPPMPASLAPWERRLAKLTHAGFYGVMLAMPLTGWIMVSTSRLAIPTLLFWTVPWPDLPGLGGLAPDLKHLWNEAGKLGHGAIIKLAYGLIALHVAGALKHQLFDRQEPVLARMAPGAQAGRWWEPRLFVIAIGLVAIVAFGKLVQPPHPRSAPPPALTPAPEPIPPEPAPSTSQVAPTAAKATPDAEPVAWRLSPGSTLGFTTAWSGEAIEGRFERWTAAILFSPEALDRSSVKVSIDLATARTGDAQRDASITSPDWFDVATHPTATFTARRFSKSGEGRFIAHGRLSLRGVTRPLDLPFRLKIDGDRAEVSGVTSLDRTVFGVGQGEWASTDQIPAKVTIRIAVKARRN